MGWSTAFPNARGITELHLPSILSDIQGVFKLWQCSNDYWMNINPPVPPAWKSQAVPEEPLMHFFLLSKSSARVNSSEERACMAHTLLLTFCSN